MKQLLEFIEKLKETGGYGFGFTTTGTPATFMDACEMIEEKILELKKPEPQAHLNLFKKVFKNYGGVKTSYLAHYKKFVSICKRYGLDVVETIKKSAETIEKERQYLEQQKQRGFPQQWKHLATWINNLCWDSEYPDFKSNPEDMTEEQRKRHFAEKRKIEQQEARIEYERNRDRRSQEALEIIKRDGDGL